MKGYLYRLAKAGVRWGVHPSWLGYRCVLEERVEQQVHRSRAPSAAFRTVHPEEVSAHALPCNVDERAELPKDRGWWGYSFWDVPARRNAATFVATLPRCMVVPSRDPERGEFWPAIVTEEGWALHLREMRFRDHHAQILREGLPRQRFERATWILERVYDNHSHWLTAHLPKIVLLKELGLLDDVLMPREMTSIMDGSLRMLGLDPAAFVTFETDRPLLVDKLTIVGTDRFRPALLRSVRDALAAGGASSHRRVYISRAKATRRRLVNEDAVWSLLEAYGFEQVFMEDLTFEAQVRIMQEAAVVVAPHGAGLTNMMFCAPGTHVVEIADLSFPNPNFYALAAGMGLHYWILDAQSVDDTCHPLERDMRVSVAEVDEVLGNLLANMHNRQRIDL